MTMKYDATNLLKIILCVIKVPKQHIGHSSTIKSFHMHRICIQHLLKDSKS
jgi:hypothetical protein